MWTGTLLLNRTRRSQTHSMQRSRFK
jgi:hypothetical protein